MGVIVTEIVRIWVHFSDASRTSCQPASGRSSRHIFALLVFLRVVVIENLFLASRTQLHFLVKSARINRSLDSLLDTNGSIASRPGSHFLERIATFNKFDVLRDHGRLFLI